MVTDEQVRLLRRAMQQNKTQKAAAAVAGMSERTAREWQTGPLPSQAKQTRTYKTRKDPFEEVWESDVLPLLQRDAKGKLEAKTILQGLQIAHPDKFGTGHLRTLQRRLRDWRALQGPDREVYFEQEHPAGKSAHLDFTNCNGLDVTIAGNRFDHLLFEFVLAASSWTWISVALSESFEALVEGLQGALWKLGGVPVQIVTDNLSAATHELRQGGGRALNSRFKGVCDHLNIDEVRRINVRKGNENGVVESRHNRTKKQLVQALIIRGDRDFETVEEYQQFARDVVDVVHNEGIEQALQLERPLLKPLPAKPVPAYSEYEPVVRKWSTIRVRGRTYSVPSRLIGHRVTARLHAQILEIWYGNQRVETYPRLRGKRLHRIDYRHVIGALRRKPGAFSNYRYREELFPTLTFRRCYDALRAQHGDRADVEYVRILNLAAETMECRVDDALRTVIGGRQTFDFAAIEAAVVQREPETPTVHVSQPDLAQYDRLITEVEQ